MVDSDTHAASACCPRLLLDKCLKKVMCTQDCRKHEPSKCSHIIAFCLFGESAAGCSILFYKGFGCIMTKKYSILKLIQPRSQTKFHLVLDTLVNCHYNLCIYFIHLYLDMCGKHWKYFISMWKMLSQTVFLYFVSVFDSYWIYKSCLALNKIF